MHGDAPTCTHVGVYHKHVPHNTLTPVYTHAHTPPVANPNRAWALGNCFLSCDAARMMPAWMEPMLSFLILFFVCPMSNTGEKDTSNMEDSKASRPRPALSSASQFPWSLSAGQLLMASSTGASPGTGTACPPLMSYGFLKRQSGALHPLVRKAWRMQPCSHLFQYREVSVSCALSYRLFLQTL